MSVRVPLLDELLDWMDQRGLRARCLDEESDRIAVAHAIRKLIIELNDERSSSNSDDDSW